MDGVRVLVIHGDEEDEIQRGPGSTASAPGARWYVTVRNIDYALRRITTRIPFLPFAIPVLRFYRLFHRDIQAYEKKFIANVVRMAKENHADIVVTGHLHMPKMKWWNGLYCNMAPGPGSGLTCSGGDARWIVGLLRWHAGQRPTFKRWTSIVRLSPAPLMEKLRARFTAPAFPPTDIVPRPSDYVPGLDNYALMNAEGHLENHFRHYLAGTDRALSGVAVDVLESFLKRVADLRMTPRAVEEIVYEFIHAAIGDWNPLRTR